MFFLMVMCVSLYYCCGFSNTITAWFSYRSWGREQCVLEQRKKDFFALVFVKYKILSNICINGPARTKRCNHVNCWKTERGCSGFLIWDNIFIMFLNFIWLNQGFIMPQTKFEVKDTV